MNINKNSWHYKLFCWTYTFWDSSNSVPEETNLCSYTQRIFWLIPAILLLHVFFGVLLLFIYVIFAPILFVFGFRPINILTSNEDGLFKPYKGLFGFIKPWHLVMLVLCCYLEDAGWHKYPTAMEIGHFIGAAVILLSLLVIWFDSGSETARLAKAWFSAKKSHVCPIVKFSEEPTTTIEDM